jgi:hypothetical protein
MIKNLARLLIGIVLLWNVQCALAFLLWPGAFAGGFELAGGAGSAMLQGLGLLFLMWNVPYAVALLDPLRYRVSVYESAAMQAIGFAGEAVLFAQLPPGHAVLQNSVQRFLWFDGIGLILLLVAVWLVRRGGY